MSAKALTSLLILILTATCCQAVDWCAGPTGKPENAGTAESPWDIASALGGRKSVKAGDTVYLLDGTYSRRPEVLFDVRLQGRDGLPIVVRPAPGARARIDGGLSIQKPSAWLEIRDLEIFISEPRPDKPVSAGSSPKDLNRPGGGLHTYGGANCKYINLIIHNTNQAISSWAGEIDPEFYGIIMYDNGWLGVDRGHGHCIYTQNREGVKTISNCIMTCLYKGTYTMHAYGSSRADVDNYLLLENIAYSEGPFLIGGGKPSRGIRACRNFLYGVDMRIGYTAPYNEDCEITDNIIGRGSLNITNYRKVQRSGNIIIGRNDQWPSEPRTCLLPNRYDSNRAHLVIYNRPGHKTVKVRVSGFLNEGQSCRLMDPKNVFGEPVATARCTAGAITAPCADEFAVFVVFKDH